MKKTLSFVLAILLLIAVMPSAALAEEPADSSEQSAYQVQEAETVQDPSDGEALNSEPEAPSGQAGSDEAAAEQEALTQNAGSDLQQEAMPAEASEEDAEEPLQETVPSEQESVEQQQTAALAAAEAAAAAESEAVLQPEFAAYLEKFGSLWLAEVYFADVDMSLWTSLTLQITKGSNVIGEYQLAYTPEEIFGEGVYTDYLLCELIEEGIWQAVKQIPDNTDMAGTVLTAIALVDGVTYTMAANAVGEGTFNSNIIPVFDGAYLEETETGWEAGFDFKNVNLNTWELTAIEVYGEEGLIGEYVLVTSPAELFGTNGYYTGSLSFDFKDNENWEAITAIPADADFAGNVMLAFTIADNIITTLYAEAVPAPDEPEEPEEPVVTPKFLNAYLVRPAESGGVEWNAGVDFKNVDLGKWTNTTFRIQKGEEVIGEYILQTDPSVLYGTNGVYSGTLSCGLFEDEHWDAVKQIRDTQDMGGAKLIVIAEVGGKIYTAEADVTGEGTFGKVPGVSNAYLAKPAESGGTDWNAGVDFKDVRLSQWTKTTFRVVKGEEVIGEYELKADPSDIYGTSGVFSGTLSCGLFEDEYWDAVKQIKDIQDMTDSKLVVTVVVDGETYTAQASAAGEGTFGKIPEVFNAYLAKPAEAGLNEWNAGVDFKDVRMSRWTKTTFRVVSGDAVIGEYELKTAPSTLYGTPGVLSGTLSCALVGDEHWNVVRQIPGNTDMSSSKLIVTVVIDGVIYTAEADTIGEGEFVNVPYFTNAYLAMPNETGWNAGVDFKNVELSEWTKTTFKILNGSKVIGEYELKTVVEVLYGTNGKFSGTLSSALVQDAYWKAVRQIPGGTDMTGTRLVVTAVVGGVTYTVSADAIGEGKFVNIAEVVTAPPKTGDGSKSQLGLMLMVSGLILAAAVLKKCRDQTNL